MIKLSPRLQIIYDMVPNCETIADVGCDHGYLTIALLEGGVAEKAIAMDVNKGPLESAKANIGQAGLLNQVQFRLSDGLAKLNEAEADVICICGMGGALIKRILDSGIAVAKSAGTLILEPQSEYRALREFLMQQHFVILDEMLCTEEGKIYPIIKVSYNPNENLCYNDIELEYGPIIIKNRPELLNTLLEKNKNEYCTILEKLEEKSDVEADSPIQKRKKELSDKLSMIRRLQA
ncbi:MAG: class I SAM-dependent methyltransferase [Pseudobutyrivibrio sp.]|nr:class I SAM-dependent methyltransferase [Pseudobutyrivibrio sp.]